MPDETDTVWTELRQNLALANAAFRIRERSEAAPMAIVVIGTTLKEMNLHLLPGHLATIDMPSPAIACLLLAPRRPAIQLAGYVDDVLPNHRSFDHLLHSISEKPILIEDLIAERRASDMAPMLRALDQLMLRDQLTGFQEPIALKIEAFDHDRTLMTLEPSRNMIPSFGQRSTQRVRAEITHRNMKPPRPPFAPPRALKSFRKR